MLNTIFNFPPPKRVFLEELLATQAIANMLDDYVKCSEFSSVPRLIKAQ